MKPAMEPTIIPILASFERTIFCFLLYSRLLVKFFPFVLFFYRLVLKQSQLPKKGAEEEDSNVAKIEIRVAGEVVKQTSRMFL